jgi:site-specific recombinase XerD
VPRLLSVKGVPLTTEHHTSPCDSTHARTPDGWRVRWLAAVALLVMACIPLLAQKLVVRLELTTSSLRSLPGGPGGRNTARRGLEMRGSPVSVYACRTRDARNLIGGRSGGRVFAACKRMPKLTTSPGVTVFRHRGVWIGRWVDPRDGRRRELQLDRQGVADERGRLAWRKRKADELAGLRRARHLGVLERTALADAVEAYRLDVEARLRSRTQAAYRQAVDDLATWMGARGRRSVQDLTPQDLMAYRAAAVRTGAKASTVSTHLSRVRAALEWWRRAQLLPWVTRDAIADACRGLTRERRAVSCLRTPQLRALLEAALALEDEPEAAAAIALDLLTGLRAGELEALARSEVDLRAAPAGELRLTPATKTHTARVVDLAVSSTAGRILEALLEDGRAYALGGAAPLSRDVARRWKRTLQLDGLAWTWQHLRQTTGCYLTCAPGIFGSASIYRTARQLGHRVDVCERFYLDVVRGIPPEAKTLEAAMGCEDRLRLPDRGQRGDRRLQGRRPGGAAAPVVALRRGVRSAPARSRQNAPRRHEGA